MPLSPSTDNTPQLQVRVALAPHHDVSGPHAAGHKTWNSEGTALSICCWSVRVATDTRHNPQSTSPAPSLSCCY